MNENLNWIPMLVLLQSICGEIGGESELYFHSILLEFISIFYILDN